MASRSAARASSMMRSNKRRIAASVNGPALLLSAFASTSFSRSGWYSGRLAACLSLPISRAQRERSFKSSTSFLSISSMRRRQSSRFMTPPRTGNESRFLAPRKHSERKKHAARGMTSTRMDAIEGRSETEVESRKLKVERKTFAEDGLDGYSWGDLAPMHRGLAAGKTVAGSFLERAETRSKSGSGGVNGGRCRIWHSRFFNFGHERRADDGGVREAAENGNMAGERDAEADSNGELRDPAGAAQKRGQIVGESIFGAGNTGAGDEIEEAGGAGGDFSEALVRGSGRAKKDRVEMMSGEDAAIVAGFLGCEVGSENAVGASGCGDGGEFFEAHLQNGIVVAEEDERDLRGLANAAN